MKTIEVTDATMNEIQEAKEYLKTKGMDVDESEIVWTAINLVRMIVGGWSYVNDTTIAYALADRGKKDEEKC